MSAGLLALALLPRIDAQLEVGWDLIDEDLRGQIVMGAAPRLIEGAGWHLTLSGISRTWVRENDRRREGALRISPQQIHYQAAARLGFPQPGATEQSTEQSWGIFAFHQSNHDVDQDADPLLNIETVSYEIYGADWMGPGWRLAAGVYYDRGTTRALKRQNLPFDYYLAGVRAEGALWVRAPWFVAGSLEAIAHRGGAHSPAYLNLSGWSDAGAAWSGQGGVWRIYLRLLRLEDYRYLGDTPIHLLLLGTRIDTERLIEW